MNDLIAVPEPNITVLQIPKETKSVIKSEVHTLI